MSRSSRRARPEPAAPPSSAPHSGRLSRLAAAIAASPARQHLLFLAATVVTVLFVGYHFGTFDQTIHIPFLKKYVDPSLYPGDPFLELRLQHYSYFWFLFRPFYRAGVLEITLFIAHCAATYGTFWAVYGLSRTLFRNDLAALGRTLNDPLPAPGMIGPGEAVLEAYGAFLAACRASLNNGPRPDRVAFAKAHVDFQDAVQALRAAGVMRGIPFDDLAQTFGFVFAVESLYGNLSDLADRLQEASDL